MVFVPVFEKMLEIMSWRAVLRIMAPIFAGVLYTSALVLRFPTHIAEAKAKEAAQRKADGKRSFAFDFSYFWDPLWRRFTYAVVLAAMGYFTPFAFMSVHIYLLVCHSDSSFPLRIPYAKVAVGSTGAATCGSIVGFANIVGRVMCGFLADRIGVIRMFQIGCGIGGAATCLLPAITPYWPAYVYLHAALFGTFGGAFIAVR
jgi:MFS family permease